MQRLYCLFLPLLVLACVQSVAAKKLKVGIAGSPPFVIGKDASDGVTVRVWNEIARQQGLEFTLVPVASVGKLLDRVASQELDVGIGPISITSARAEKVAFTQPYYHSSLGLMSHAHRRGLFDAALAFMSRRFWLGVAFLVSLLAVVGSLIWVSEKRANPEQFPNGISGVGQGMWFAIVTMTTVGYGDRCPTTTAGRFVAACWMMVATISFSTLTAGIATAMTVAHLESADITSPEMLRGRQVAVVAGTTSAEAADHFGAQIRAAKDLEAAVQLLQEGRVEAVVFDHPALEYYLYQHQDLDLRLAESMFGKQDYGFALSIDDAMTHELNVALLQLAETGKLKELEQRFLSSSETSES